MKFKFNINLSASMQRILSVARKEIRQLMRDVLTMGFVVGVPAVQLLLFGYAINQDVRNVRTAVVDHSNSYISRQLIGQLEATQTFRICKQLDSDEKARELLKEGDVRVVVVVPPDYTRSYYRGRGAEISILVDATDPILARAVRASANGLMDKHNRRLQSFDINVGESALRVPRERTTFGTKPDLVRQRFLRFSVINLYNPELRTPVFVVPALLGVILTTTMILMTALSIVRERERGSFEFLIATPVSRLELMTGKILPYICIGIIQIVIVVFTGLLLFDVPVAGSLIDLGVVSLFFIAANLTLGLVISSVTASQFQATQLSFFFFLPSVLLSGFMFPFGSMPAPAQWIGETLPLTHFIRAARGILLRGSSLFEHMGEIGAMLLFSVILFGLATRLFKKRLD
ncbi:MAG: ABC transporter permease [Candidatus Aminicenantes bacterium]|nr:ABC transporter permease [Candidatus Aminicenantes bacterium]NIM84329.1 ABC transporter permease [Candidatus Aminicenantes bacterium]NIN23815.1 ABC transporter permease [Candidatus Aminicenantes bacterium]NIN47531.1 ABC transporter permease [Candidatus Aminicenantes bacterium]NIN90451.1 ABC transporter permease [Candidatus Aminicenantes bacterium]